MTVEYWLVPSIRQDQVNVPDLVDWYTKLIVTRDMLACIAIKLGLASLWLSDHKGKLGAELKGPMTLSASATLNSSVWREGVCVGALVRPQLFLFM